MGKYKCIIFDCDGVLVDSEPITNQVLVDMTNELGGNIDLKYALTHFKGGSMQDCYHKIAKLLQQPLPDNFIEAYRTRSYDLLKNEIKPIKGVKTVLDNLKIPFCVASSGPIEKIRLNLNTTGLLPYFEGNIFSCYTIQKWKPDPSIFLLAAKTMGFKINECLVIEDSLLGVKAAQNGGFDVFGYTAHDYNNELKSEVTQTFDSMDLLLKML
ncbi:MAG: HAD family hydrolase [Flavobacteriaceae bacterium]|tara:strand:+ start:3413 stop:4048 length:636 start_codon:yes stop_codon:yes gene_type:complete